MTTLPSRVPDYTTNLTKLEIATGPELGRLSWMPQRQWMSMPEVATGPELV